MPSLGDTRRSSKGRRPELRDADGVSWPKELDALEREITGHIRRHFGRDLATLDDGGARRLVRLGIMRAVWHGLKTRREAAHYVDLMVLFGCEFDHDPQYPWAMTLLGSRSAKGASHPMMEHLVREAIQYAKDVRGAQGKLYTRALLKARSFSFVQVAAAGDDPSAIAQLLHRLHPRKVARLAADTASHEGDGLREWIEVAVREARTHGLEGAAGVYVAAAFLLGSGFPHNPRFAWAARALDAGPFGKPPPRKQAKALYDAATQEIARALAVSGGET